MRYLSRSGLSFLIVILCFSTLAFWGPPKLDGSSKEALERSVREIEESLSPEKYEEFQRSLLIIGFSSFDFNTASDRSPREGSPDPFLALRDLDGMTADQIIARGKQISLEKEARKREQALLEMQELESERQKAEAAAIALKEFKVLSAHFYVQDTESGFFQKPIIDITVKNGTDYPVSRFYCKGVLISPGRHVPWIEDTFNYSIPGGLEPGEARNWRLEPNRLSDWGRVEVPDDALFQVTVYRIDGPDREQLFAADFSEAKARRLQALRETYAPEKKQDTD